MQRALEGAAGPVIDAIRAFIADTLGNPAVTRAICSRAGRISPPSWHACGRWRRSLPWSPRSRSTSPIRERPASRSGCARPPTAASSNCSPSGCARPGGCAGWPPIWRRSTRADELEKLARLRTELEHDLARAYHDLVVARTWLKLAENATPRVRAALQAYLNAVQRIGKGTGKRAVRYRQDARAAAAEANHAVPCWIMPHYRVSESLPAELGCFDLVIIDEASQSDLSALPALLRARKILIVGDDRQVSPEGVGMEEEKVKSLMQRFLSDQVPLYRAQMSPERSIYDLAKVVFAHSGVMLKEHFRCVAPIIEYSKREFYHHELKPLRLPRPSERLDPPLIDVYIEDGVRKDGLNPAEIDYIVQEIARIAADPRMAQRSIGVVSLLGEEQALKVWARLAEELGPQALQRHALACGDARTFQGKERDIMFLSMVSAPNDVGAPLSREMFAQRFNVAASRARDRMYLVRSVGLEHLSDSDRLRRGLIMHFARPFLEEEARLDDPRTLCASPFERELYDWLVGRGYRVTPAGAGRRLSHRSGGGRERTTRAWRSSATATSTAARRAGPRRCGASACSNAPDGSSGAALRRASCAAARRSWPISRRRSRPAASSRSPLRDRSRWCSSSCGACTPAQACSQARGCPAAARS